MYPVLRRARYCLLPIAFAAGVIGPGCGGGTVSSTKAVEAFNRLAEARNVALECPEEFDKDKREVDCTLRGTKTGKTAPVKIESLSDEDDLIEAADGAEFNRAVQQVTQP